jgi:hypothetical protein
VCPQVVVGVRRRGRQQPRRLRVRSAGARCRDLGTHADVVTGSSWADAIAECRGDAAVLGPRSTAIYHERNRVAAELEVAPPPSEFVGLHPAALACYEEQLGRLQKALADGVQSGDSECAMPCGNWWAKVTVFRDPSGPGAVEIEITRRVAVPLGEKAYPNKVRGVP